MYVAASVTAVVVAVALAATSAPSSPGRIADGPFGPSGTRSVNAECIPISGRIITYGFEGVRNTGSSAATVQKIGYLHPFHLPVLEAFVVPVHGALYGGQNGYPPRSMLAERSRTVRPARSNAIDDYVNVILVTRLTGETGHADAVYLDYEENGVRYYYRTITSLTLKHGGKCT